MAGGRPGNGRGEPPADKGRAILKALIHALNEQDFALLKIAENDFEVINANDSFAPCMGCFHCWLKTPGVCKIELFKN
ncbi:MAG: hypothetical protein LBU16_08915 [Treponema sp.]|nr:hypothetical protein [Treponema sp.]